MISGTVKSSSPSIFIGSPDRDDKLKVTKTSQSQKHVLIDIVEKNIIINKMGTKLKPIL